MKFVQSNQVKDLFGLIFVESVVLFVRDNVFPHEERFCYFKRHALFHLETHTNCGQEGTNNGVKNCASPVMPQSRLDGSIKTLNLNAQIKAKNTSLMVCNKANRQKLWSDLPTSAHVTDPCESMLKMEWKRAADWISYRVSEWRWLAIHRLDLVRSSVNYWSDEETDSDLVNSDEEELDVESPPHDAPKKAFGPIPRFSRVYEVKASGDPKVFSCTCCNQERMGMPCRHIASVCQGNNTILGETSTGFPLSSVCVFWWNQYYLYGMSKRKDHQEMKEALMALANNNTVGLPCPENLDCPLAFSCPEHIFESFHKPVTDRLLNYNSLDAMGASQLLHDRNNPLCHPEAIPAGLSQVSYLPTQEDDWSHSMEELSDTVNYLFICKNTCALSCLHLCDIRSQAFVGVSIASRVHTHLHFDLHFSFQLFAINHHCQCGTCRGFCFPCSLNACIFKMSSHFWRDNPMEDTCFVWA